MSMIEGSTTTSTKNAHNPMTLKKQETGKMSSLSPMRSRYPNGIKELVEIEKIRQSAVHEQEVII